MLKRMRFVVLAFILSLSLMLAACGNSEKANSEKGEEIEITLNYSDHDPPGGMRTKFIEEVWIPEIEKQTNGKVKINANFGGALLNSQEVLDGVSNGVTDIGMIFPDFYPEKLYSYQIFKMFPEAPQKWENISTVYQQSLDQLPKLSEELESLNQKPLLITAGLPTVFGSPEKIQSIEKLVGNDWRASSRWHLEALKHIGANPVSVPWEDVYMSLETGVIDGVMTNYDGFHVMKFHEAAPEIIVAPQLWWSTPFLHTINLDKWNSLPEDVQQGILKATEIAQEKFSEVYSSELEETIEEQRANGATVKIADDKDIEFFTDPELLNKIRATWSDEAKAKYGIENPDEYIEKLGKIMEEALNNEK